MELALHVRQETWVCTRVQVGMRSRLATAAATATAIVLRRSTGGRSGKIPETQGRIRHLVSKHPGGKVRDTF